MMNVDEAAYLFAVVGGRAWKFMSEEYEIELNMRSLMNAARYSRKNSRDFRLIYFSELSHFTTMMELSVRALVRVG